MTDAIDPAIESRITEARLSAHLATSVDDRPHVAPIWYVYDNGVLSVLTGGKKLANIRRNPRVALSIERAGEAGVEWSVHLLGTARIVSDPTRVAVVQDRMDEKYAGPYGADGGELDEDWGLVEITIGSATAFSY